MASVPRPTAIHPFEFRFASPHRALPESYGTTEFPGWHMLIVHATDALAKSLRGPGWIGEAERPLTLVVPPLGCLSKESAWATTAVPGKRIPTTLLLPALDALAKILRGPGWSRHARISQPHH